MIPTLQYLANLGILISEAPPNNPSPLVLVNLLQINLQKLADSKGSAIVYTDGSTAVRTKNPNSGCSIHITDEKHTHVWSV